MARYYRRRGRKRSSQTSMWATATIPFRWLPKQLGVKSPIGQMLIGTPIMLGVMAKFMPDLYAKVMEFPETITDFIDSKMGGTE